MLLTNVILYGVGYDILPMHFTSLPLDIRTDTDFLQVCVPSRHRLLKFGFRLVITYLVSQLCIDMLLYYNVSLNQAAFFRILSSNQLLHAATDTVSLSGCLSSTVCLLCPKLR